MKAISLAGAHRVEAAGRRGGRHAALGRYGVGVRVRPAACVAALVLAAIAGCGGDDDSTASGKSSGLTPLAAPRAVSLGTVADGIQCGPTEEIAYHIHQHLAIYVNGRQRLVPYGIGIGKPWEI